MENNKKSQVDRKKILKSIFFRKGKFLYNISEKFNIAKSCLNIKEVAESYGLHLDRSGRALCPWHSDRHPSLSFKGDYGGFCHCFACNNGGDVFALVGQLTGISKPVEVLKLLNRDFCLGLDLEQRKLTKSELATVRQREQTRQAKGNFRKWVMYAFRVCTSYAKLLRTWQIQLAPRSENDEPDERFIESLQNIATVEYLCDILTYGSEDDFKSFYTANRREVDRIAERLQQLNR